MTDPDLQQKRLIAAAIDSGLMMVIGFVASLVLGAFGYASSSSELISGYAVGFAVFVLIGVCLAYVLTRDLLAGGRSLGKNIMGVRLVTESGRPIGLVDSVKRNAVFAPPFVLWLVSAGLQLLPLGSCAQCLSLPLELSAAALALAGAVYELMLIVQQPDGTRMGDRVAETRVVR